MQHQSLLEYILYPFRQMPSEHRSLFLLILGFKLLMLTLFSSDYQNIFFLPFIDSYLNQAGNPWDYLLAHPGPEFPYQPLMLYVFSFFYLPVYLFDIQWQPAINFFFKLPNFFADIAILWTLMKVCTNRTRRVLVLYFASPILIYAVYMHSQLDLIPTALLSLAIYFISIRKPLPSSIFFGLALACKLHVLVALPILLIYLSRSESLRKYLIHYLVLFFGTYFFLSSPYLFSEGFRQLVLQNPKQNLIFNSYFELGQHKIFLVFFATILIYAWFLRFKRYNSDLLFLFVAIIFSIFLLLIVPSPAWYIWMLPFVCVFFIKAIDFNRKLIFHYVFLNLAYILYYLFFYKFDVHPLSLINQPLDLQILNAQASDISFTSLQVMLTITIASYYQYGIKSNYAYERVYNSVIGIGGDSGAGKSTLTHDIFQLFGERCLRIEGDGDHKWERYNEKWSVYTHLDPKSNYLHRQAESIAKLKLGIPVKRADYDHDSGKFSEMKLIEPRDYIVIAGLHPFYLPVSRNLIDLKIYMDTQEQLRKYWKIQRDVKKRGYSVEQVLEKINERNHDKEKYIEPQKNFANFLIHYFVEEEIDLHKTNQNLQICLQITLDSSVHVQNILSDIKSRGADINWEYTDDLQNQVVTAKDEKGLTDLEDLAERYIYNLHDLSDDMKFEDGYRGLIQLLMLLDMTKTTPQANRALLP